MIFRFSDYIYEYHRRDRLMILSPEVSSQFTVAFEFELETTDTKKMYNDDLEEVHKLVSQRLLSRLRTEPFYERELDFINNILDKLYDLAIDEELDKINKLLDENRYKKPDQKIIIGLIFYEWNLYSNDNLTYLTNNVKKYLPNFYKKYNKDLKFELDTSLKRGIEFSPKKYCDGINAAIEMLDDFFKDFDNQKYWIFSERTGLHINLGMKGKHKWNQIKGLLNINDIATDTKVPFAFKNIEYRIPISHCQSILKELKDDLISNGTKLDIKDPNLENFLNNKLRTLLQEKGYKHYAFNTLHIEENNYVEFRYVGGIINKDIIVEKTLFFAYITYLMTHPEYNRASYQKKLYKFVDSINNQISNP
ncbi:MAG: hypothetical protein HPY57_15450 [Ignavibacteria bacterium]|nr:hypothetical protein [Ignavibacteria bacterium]